MKVSACCVRSGCTCLYGEAKELGGLLSARVHSFIRAAGYVQAGMAFPHDSWIRFRCTAAPALDTSLIVLRACTTAATRAMMYSNTHTHARPTTTSEVDVVLEEEQDKLRNDMERTCTQIRTHDVHWYAHTINLTRMSAHRTHPHPPTHPPIHTHNVHQHAQTRTDHSTTEVDVALEEEQDKLRDDMERTCTRIRTHEIH